MKFEFFILSLSRRRRLFIHFALPLNFVASGSHVTPRHRGDAWKTGRNVDSVTHKKANLSSVRELCQRAFSIRLT